MGLEAGPSTASVAAEALAVMSAVSGSAAFPAGACANAYESLSQMGWEAGPSTASVAAEALAVMSAVSGGAAFPSDACAVFSSST